MGLISLVYTSTATEPIDDAKLLDILTVARRNNKLLDITGMLLHKDGYFIQALEGEQTTVESLYETIKADPRHSRVHKMYSRPIRERSFGNWEMGFNQLSSIDPNALIGYTDFLTRPFDIGFFMDNPGRAQYLLEFFKTKSSF